MNLKFNILIANKMVKYTEAICWLLLKNCWSLFHHFVELTLKGLTPRKWLGALYKTDTHHPRHTLSWMCFWCLLGDCRQISLRIWSQFKQTNFYIRKIIWKPDDFTNVEVNLLELTSYLKRNLAMIPCCEPQVFHEAQKNETLTFRKIVTRFEWVVFHATFFETISKISENQRVSNFLRWCRIEQQIKT